MSKEQELLDLLGDCHLVLQIVLDFAQHEDMIRGCQNDVCPFCLASDTYPEVSAALGINP